MIMIRRLIIAKFIIIIGCMIFFFGGIVFGLAQPVNSPPANEPVIVSIPAGLAAGDIGKLLYQAGVIKYQTYFNVLAKIQRLDNSLKAGNYSFTRNMDTLQVVRMLANGETAYHKLVIPEGYNVDEIADLLQEQGLGDADKFKIAAGNLAAGEGTEPVAGVKYRLEGFLFPDTYYIPRGMTEEQILNLLVAQFHKQFTPDKEARAAAMGLSVRDTIILASLVEKEAKIDSDRPLIASVFFNRLKLDMPLQSDATIQYILNELKPELSVQDTEIPSPYNTYQNRGLPPGPIANPGLKAIDAVLYPAESDYLYFVADQQGVNHFSRIYEDHLVTVSQVR